MTAEPPQNPITEAVRSLEVRWIFPGQLETAVTGWFSRFPAGTDSREDAYLADLRLRGLSVKVRGGGALEVKAYRGSPGILEVAGRARGRMESWQKWSFPVSPPRPDSGDLAAGVAGPQEAADQPVLAGQRADRGARPRGRARSRGARWNSPRSARAARTGGRWASRRPAPPVCSAAPGRPPRSCSPTLCPVACNPAQMTPGPIRSGCAISRAPRATPAPEGCPLPSRLVCRSARHARRRPGGER